MCKKFSNEGTFAGWRWKWQPTPVFLPEISWTKKPGGLQSMGSLRVGHDWATEQHFQSREPLISTCSMTAHRGSQLSHREGVLLMMMKSSWGRSFTPCPFCSSPILCHLKPFTHITSSVFNSFLLLPPLTCKNLFTIQGSAQTAHLPEVFPAPPDYAPQIPEPPYSSLVATLPFNILFPSPLDCKLLEGRECISPLLL